MTPSKLFPILLSSLLTAGCSENATVPRMAPPDAVSLAKAPGLPTISLVVTISNTDVFGNPYNIQNDGQGEYVDGSQHVQAILDRSGTFALNTETAIKGTPIRWVTYDFNNPVDLTNPYRPNPSSAKNYHFSTGPSLFSPFTPIQNLGVNGNPGTECVYMGNGLSSSTQSWRVSFHKGQEDTSNGTTAYAFVTRTSVSPAVWTITPAGPCSLNSNVASLRSGDGTVLYGHYNLPFFFTLRAK